MKMHTKNVLFGTVLLFGMTALAGCPDDGGDDGNADDSSSGGNDTTGPSTSSPTTTSPETTSPETTSPETTSPETTSPETTDPDSSSSGGSTGDDGFMFADDPYDSYTQIDRHAAVEAGTAGIAAPSGLGLGGEDIDIRDLYNASNPAEDADGMWLGEISDSVTFFHAALDNDLQGLGLTVADVDTALAQAGPVIVPDTIKYNPANPTGYPNGRALTDQVVDITLAAVMLDLSVHSLDTFANLPLNPTENDVPFADEFPYLAPPH